MCTAPFARAALSAGWLPGCCCALPLYLVALPVQQGVVCCEEVQAALFGIHLPRLFSLSIMVHSCNRRVTDTHDRTIQQETNHTGCSSLQGYPQPLGCLEDTKTLSPSPLAHLLRLSSGWSNRGKWPIATDVALHHAGSGLASMPATTKPKPTNSAQEVLCREQNSVGSRCHK